MSISINSLKTTFAGYYSNAGNSLSDYWGISFAGGGSSPATGTTISLGDFVGKTPGASGLPYTITSLDNIDLLGTDPQYFVLNRYNSLVPPVYDTMHVPAGNLFTVVLADPNEPPGYTLTTITNLNDSIQVNPGLEFYRPATVTISFGGDSTYNMFTWSNTITYSL